MLTKTGAKLLDFGLAKDQASGLGPRASVLETAQKPLTEEGALIGTFQYMAPEQIEGAAVDARTDIFALGAVLYEMATGRRAFEGKSKASLIASILAAEPKPITAIQPMTPAVFDRVVRQCLAKEPDERWQSAHDVASELRWIAESPSIEMRTPASRTWVPWSLAALLAIATVVLGVVVWRAKIAENAAPIIRTEIAPPDKATFDFLSAGAPPAVSPDGTKIVFGAAEAGKPRTLRVRALNSFAAQQLAGTEGASFPFWSPDGRFLAFFADDALKKIEVTGGAPVVLCTIPDARGGSWSPDGRTIIFAGRYTPIFRVAASGGTPVAVTKLGDSMSTHRWPEFLPDSAHFLFLGSVNGNDDPSNAIFAGSTDGAAPKRIVTTANEPHYLNGCLIFTRSQILTAQRFDPKTLSVTGEAFPLREQHVEETPLFSRSIVSVSPAGVLTYQTGPGRREAQLTWFDRAGKKIGTVASPGPYSSLALSADGKSVLVTIGASQSNIWSFDLARGVKSRLTFSSGVDAGPVWSPDGRKMIYTAADAGHFRFVLRDLTTGADEVLLQANVAGVRS
jgi:eukaryotic-like serine/threonine-protein kinase